VSNYCPLWIASIVTAHSAMDYLTGSSQLDNISKKYARGLSSEYNEIHPGYIASIAEDKLLKQMESDNEKCHNRNYYHNKKDE
jgi:hypothetical protein